MKTHNIAVILVHPEIPENIGAVARAMRNMDFHDLRLVAPPKDWQARGWFMATFAEDLMKGAKVYETLEEAIQDRHYLIGTTRRLSNFRGFYWPFNEMLEQTQAIAEEKKIGILFGRESKGLKNEEINYCHATTTIPSNPDYPSLNLAQAVMVILFSLHLKKNEKVDFESSNWNTVPQEEVEETLEHLRMGLENLEYPRTRDTLGRVVSTFRGIFRRSGLLKREAKMLKGVGKRISQRTKKIHPGKRASS